MKIKTSNIKMLGIIYLAIPTFIFLVTWLKPIYALLSGVVLIVSTFYVFKHYLKSDENYIVFPKRMLILILGVLAVWCFISGIGGYFYQSTDHECRNLILKNLIEFDWPVVYKNGYFLTYYIGIWLLPALFGKLALITGAGLSIAITISNFCLWLWILIGISITYLLIVNYVGEKNNKSKLIILIVFIFFSGCDVLGVILRNIDFSMHLEWWAKNYQFSSNTTQLFWVFNQAVPAWIGVMLLISDNNLKKDIFVGSLLLLFSPFPLVGCFVICIGKLVSIYFIKYKQNKIGILKEMFSIPNILSVIGILPFIAIYLFSNVRVASNPSGINGFNTFIGGVSLYNILVLLLFMVLEFGLYLFIIYKENKKNYLYYICLIFLPIFCMFRFGETNDFEMRGSIPLLFVLMVLVIQYLCKHLEINKNAISFSFKGIALCVVLIIGSITPFVEMYRGYYYVRREHRFGILAEEKKEFTIDEYNFIAKNYKGSIFHNTFGK
ncbi:MAG: hypothetical protein RSC93_06455 [Erysipelotrichaceae bacterium]